MLLVNEQLREHFPGRWIAEDASRSLIEKADVQSIADLRGLGPKSQEMLFRAGITSVEQLRKLGPIPAYVMAKRANGNVSLNLLWALESAINGETWQEVSRKHRTSLLLALDDYERSV